MATSNSSPPRLGWIGLGSMGIGMAKNLQSHVRSASAPALHYFNRTISRGAPLQEIGGVACASIAEVTEKSEIVFISTSDDAALDGILNAMIESGHVKNKIVVDTTTLSESGAEFLAAPAFGASPLAESGQLLLALAGPPAARAAVKPYLAGVMARGIIEIGDDASKATMLKTTGNFIISGLMEVIAEAHVLAEKSGLGSTVLEALIKENFGALAYSDSQRMTTGVYMPGAGQQPFSGLDLALKDVGHGISCAKDVGVRLEVGEVVIGHLERAKKYSEKNRGRAMDSSSLYGVVRQDAGLEFETEFVKRRDEGRES
ncbi:NAD binding domain of 6-phosphogluconate dehydrogenase [Mytilinidion resinicola]|uniref:NAD binding domain of 6-phosphogluconate dehydrogenase n=1 Tax=Mytilinidion resinicola TaxID=574789 RepID=A0A6A6Z044_9PEZI|nr:NAD binding domain of 6-phosphogluconate dehydrogenase [Mytilinidion resinicola]KAF2813555.1 NAD binding domain of 6-phosphogluconate dehydrogenase [Mytilinidion resinicola]